MRTPGQSCVVAIVAFALISIPSFAANENPLGLVTQAQAARLGDCNRGDRYVGLHGRYAYYR